MMLKVDVKDFLRILQHLNQKDNNLIPTGEIYTALLSDKKNQSVIIMEIR